VLDESRAQEQYNIAAHYEIALSRQAMSRPPTRAAARVRVSNQAAHARDAEPVRWRHDALAQRRGDRQKGNVSRHLARFSG
jgi:hypothetical protein